MSRIQTTSNSRVTPLVGHPGAEANLIIKNLTKKSIDSHSISISVEEPKYIDVQLERAIRQGEQWSPIYDLQSKNQLVIPLFIRSEAFRSETGGSIAVTVKVDGNTYETEIDLIG